MTAYEQTMAELVQRIQRLETLMDEHRHDFSMELRTPVACAEDGRRQRWHDTRDRMLAKFSTYNCDNPLSFEEHFRQAERYADRAHGPLEAVTYDPRPHTAVYLISEVNALVKAALRLRAEYAESLPVSLGAAAEMELALRPFKPFEQEAGNG